MKKFILYSLVVSGSMFHVPGLGSDMDSLSIPKGWEITGEYDLTTPESQLQVTFLAPDSTPARSNIKIYITHYDSTGPSTFQSWTDSIIPLYIDSTGTYRAALTPGFYVLSFIHSTWGDVCTFPIGIQFLEYKGITMNVHFTDWYNMPAGGIRVDKPVIYLYPEEKTETGVKLDVKGELGFTYPNYDNGWIVTANTDGTLEADNKTYNYLFWEGKISPDLIDYDFTEGFVVHRDSLTQFFESSLTQTGLNSREQQDFITYWVPRMQKNEWNFVHFMANDAYESIVRLNVSPAPQTILRVFMVWNEINNPSAIREGIRKQSIIPTQRTGFTVVEWGGSELIKYTE